MTTYSPESPLVVGLVLFEGAEELDWAGPWEVWTCAGIDGAVRAVTIADTEASIRAANGIRLLADHRFEDAPDLDVLVVPGGIATRNLQEDDAWVAKLAALAEGVPWISSVCTGAMLLAAAGVLSGKRATTHWAALDEFEAQGDEVEVCRGERWVVDGNVVTSAGVSAGIDMSLWLAGEVLGQERAEAAALFMEYDPASPYDITAARGF